MYFLYTLLLSGKLGSWYPSLAVTMQEAAHPGQAVVRTMSDFLVCLLPARNILNSAFKDIKLM